MVKTKRKTVKKVKKVKKTVRIYKGKGIAAEVAAFMLPNMVQTQFSQLLSGLRK